MVFGAGVEVVVGPGCKVNGVGLAEPRTAPVSDWAPPGLEDEGEGSPRVKESEARSFNNFFVGT